LDRIPEYSRQIHGEHDLPIGVRSIDSVAPDLQPAVVNVSESGCLLREWPEKTATDATLDGSETRCLIQRVLWPDDIKVIPVLNSVVAEREAGHDEAAKKDEEAPTSGRDVIL
jgi:hypothetical protein